MAKMATREQKKERSFSGVKKALKWATGLFAGSVVAIALFFGGLWMFSIDTNNWFRLEHIEVSNQKYTQAQEIKQALLELEDLGFFSVSIDEVEQHLNALPWVQDVQLRKVWPNQLHIKVNEHRPLAYWNENSVVSIDGNVFTPLQESVAGKNWVSLRGPELSSVEVSALYAAFKQQLEATPYAIATMTMSERGAIELELVNKQADSVSFRVILGAVNIEQRFARLAQYVGHIDGYKGQVLHSLDLRYENGVAASWTEGAVAVAEQ